MMCEGKHPPTCDVTNDVTSDDEEDYSYNEIMRLAETPRIRRKRSSLVEPDSPPRGIQLVRREGHDSPLPPKGIRKGPHHTGLLHYLYSRLARAWKGVTFREADTDDVELNVVRYKVDGIDTLAKSTKFTKKELQLMYRGFKAECPAGVVSEDTFKSIYSQFFPQGDATAYAHYVFNTFDTDSNGSISFENFVSILSELSRGTTAEKLRWAFSLYDINRDGYISKEELADIVTAVYSLLGRNASPSVGENTTKDHVDRIFEKLDLNGDGLVTMDEFMQTCSSDEKIANSLTILDTAFNCDNRQNNPPCEPLSNPEVYNPSRGLSNCTHHFYHNPIASSSHFYHQETLNPDTPFSPWVPVPATHFNPPEGYVGEVGVNKSPRHHRSMPGDRHSLRDFRYPL